MTNQDMVTAIIQSIQTDSNLIILLRLMITNNLPNVIPQDGSISPQLMVACQALGIPTS